MTILDTSINISRNSAFDYVGDILYKKAADLIQREYYGNNQSCKFNHLQDYYYLIEVLTFIRRRIDCIVENECLTFDKIKKIYDNLSCVTKCFACNNMPYFELLRLFDIDTKFVKGLNNKYLIQYTVELWEDDRIVSSTTQYLGTSGEDYTLIIETPEDYTYFALIVDNVRQDLENSYTFENLSCIHKVIARFRLGSCLVDIPSNLVLTLDNAEPNELSVSWTDAGEDILYTVKLYNNGNLIDAVSTESLSATFTGLLPVSAYVVTVTATNCAGALTVTGNFQTPPYVIVVEVVNGTSTVSGINEVDFGDNFEIDFTSTGGYVIQSFEINNIVQDNSILDITGYVLGYPQTGTYELTNVRSNMYIKIIYYEIVDVCSEIDVTYSSNTIRIE